MRAKLSVVMPTLDAAPALARSLPALSEGLQAGLIRELVISDGGSCDETIEIAEKSGALLVRGEASRGGQLKRGAEVAEGEWLLFLHADTVLPEGWAAAVLAHLSSGRPACFQLGFDARGIAPRLVAGWANVRTKVFHLPYGDQCLLISATEYRKIGGYDDIPLMEDVAMARKLKRRLTALPLRVTTSAARYERDGWLRRGAGNLLRLARFLAGADPARLARRY